MAEQHTCALDYCTLAYLSELILTKKEKKKKEKESGFQYITIARAKCLDRVII